MKKLTLFIFVLVAMSIKTSAQIPNPGFEDWTIVGNCMEPNSWYCTNNFADVNGSAFAITRSTDHYPTSIGNYSIRLENNTSLYPDFQSIGFAWTGDIQGSDFPVFPVTGHPISLCGYYKFIPQNGDTMDIHVCLYSNGIEVAGGNFLNTLEAEDWNSFNIPISEYNSADSARIMIGTTYMDVLIPHGNSVLYIDNLSFDDLIISLPEQTTRDHLINLFPNPAKSEVILNFEKLPATYLEFAVYTIAGSMIKTEMIQQNNQQITIENLEDGIYLVEIKWEQGSEKQKLVVQH